MQKTKRLELRINEKTENQLVELQRILTQRIGTTINKTKAIEIAIDQLLYQLSNNQEQARLI